MTGGASPLRRLAPATATTAALLALLLGLGRPRPAAAAHALFQPDTARTLPVGRLEVGVFGPLRWGVTDRLELALHPLLALVAPQLDATFAWGAIGSVEVASHHGLLYPTPLMRLLSREGTGGIVPHDVTYPHILATSHHLRLSRALGAQLLTLRAGGRLARHLTRFDGPRFWSEVEWHVVRPRTAAWFTGFSVDAGLALEGPLWRGLGYRVELDGYLMPGLRGDKAAEATLLATWQPRATLQLRLGAMLSWCEFPYGSRLSVPLPLVDVSWSFDAPWH
ncbi:MAG: hypothetical protein IPG96_10065 [Proteobacteria bacterium]|nr:hypothetical protein [Pseudomonadota bacterium]